MRKFSFPRFYVSLFLFIVMPKSPLAQINAATWIGFNSYTDAFPITASSISPAVISSANINFKGLLQSDDHRSLLRSNNASPRLDPRSAPYLSFNLKLLASQITFDKFVMHGLAFENQSTLAQLRWSVDNYATSLGEFTGLPDFKYTLTSIDLSMFPSVSAKSVEFRIYYYNGTGIIAHADSGKYNSLDGTAAFYANKCGMASIWVKDANVPTTIEQFRGREDEGNIQLKWHTSSEQNISHFEIERSIDGITFFNAGRVNALGYPTAINKYHFTDRMAKDINSEMIFYRLWMLDKNGVASYSNIVPILVKKHNTTALLYPNPVKDMAILVITSPVEDAIRYTITDIKQRILQTAKHALQQGHNTVNINIANLPAGTYIMQITGNNINTSLRFIK